MIKKGIDCMTPLTAVTAVRARTAGFDFAGRYLVPPDKYPGKALTRAEAEAVTAAGLRLLTVWETYANRAKEGAAAGAFDGFAALQCARALDMPESGIIYFAVDYDAPEFDFPAIAEYLKAARAQTGPYHVGVYGSCRVVEAMKQRGICRGFWQCCAWSYGKRSPALTVYQSDWSGTEAAKAAAAKIGVSVDLNECPDLDRAGVWTYTKEEEESDEMKRYNTLAELPDWGRATVETLVRRGIIRGGGQTDKDGNPADLNLSEDMLRTLVWNDRAGLYNIFNMEDDGK